jgi:hypothetical protein
MRIDTNVFPAIRLATALITKTPDGMACVPRRAFGNSLQTVTNKAQNAGVASRFIANFPSGRPCVERRIFGNSLQNVASPALARQEHSKVAQWLAANPVEGRRLWPAGVAFADSGTATPSRDGTAQTSSEPSSLTWQKPLLDKLACSGETLALAQRRLDALADNVKSDPKFKLLSVDRQREVLKIGGEKALTQLGYRLRQR